MVAIDNVPSWMEAEAKTGSYNFLRAVADGEVDGLQLKKRHARRLNRILNTPWRWDLMYGRIRKGAVSSGRVLGDGTLLEIILDWLANGGIDLIIEIIMIIIGLPSRQENN